jgi:signal transduction histidine kinase
MLVVTAYILPILALLAMLILLAQGESRNQKLTKSFRYLLIILIFWSSLLWVTDQLNNPPYSLITLRLGLFVASLLPAFLYFFFSRLVNSFSRIIAYTLLIVSTLFAVLSLTPLMVKTISRGEVGIEINKLSLLYSLQTFYGVVGFVFSYVWAKWKSQKLDQKIKMQIKTIGWGLYLAIFIGLLGGYVLRNTGSNLLLPLALMFFALSIFIAIFKHGLFDIRLIVARSVAYVFSLLAVGAAFGLFSYVISNVFIGQSKSINPSTRVTYIVIAVLLAVIFPLLKRFFDRVTDRIFYQDSYDSQAFFDHFNRTLVSTFELNNLLKKCGLVIQDNIKPSSFTFVILATDKTRRKVIGSDPKLNLTDKLVYEINKQTKALKKRVIVAELLQSSYKTFKNLLVDINITVIVSLGSASNYEGIGFLLLGPKKSGNAYTSNDIKNLQIVSDELGVAIQNSLYTEEIENFNLTLQQKVIDATRKLRKTNDKLRALDEAKDDFVSMASHQLRTPLTSVKGNISLVLDGDAGAITKLQRQLLDQAFASSQRMVYLIADLLNVSRLKTGKFVIERSPVNLADVIEEEVNQLIDTALSRQLTLTYKKPENITELMLDDTKTRQVIMNFIDNAIYYTPAGGRIDVMLSETASVVECRVIDNGIGVPKSDQHHLFTKFFRAVNARKARPDGTGLGLFMAKKVIAAEGGAIIFESVEGKGSTFGFSFPKAVLAIGKIQNGAYPVKNKQHALAQ